MTALYPEMLEINSITNDGQLTGMSRSGHVFKAQLGGAFQEFGTLFSFGAGINDAGEVGGVGWHDLERTLPRTAFRYSEAAGYVELGTLRGGISGARAINRNGVTVGFSGGTEGVPVRAFRARPGLPMEDLGVLPGGFLGGESDAYAMNDLGGVVGIADGRFGYSPFLYTDAHGMIDLRDRITTGERLVFSMDVAEAINNAGQIVAGYNSPTGAYGTVRLTPVLREFGGPVAAPTVEPSELRPVNNRMVPISVDPHVTDEYDPEAACRIVRVVNSQAAPHAGPDRDVEITGALSVNLRASRSGPGDGRTYTIKLGCTDALGVTSRSDVIVTVGHDHGSND